MVAHEQTHSELSSPESEDGRVDRVAFRHELETVFGELGDLLNEISDDDWAHKNTGTNWTLGEVAYHVYASVLSYYPREVECARTGKDLFNPPAVLAPIMGTITYYVFRRQARTSSALSLRTAFVGDVAAALRAFDSITEEEWHKGAHFYGEGFRSQEDLVRLKRRHFEEHAGQIRGARARG